MRPIPDDCYVYVGVKSAGSGGRHTALAQGEALIRKRLSVLLGTLQMLRVWTVLAALLLAVIIVASLRPPEANAQATLPLGFHEKVVISGLSEPANVEFSKDGRIFVAEKSGLIKVFDNLSDTTPTTFADLRTNVFNLWDRGLLGLALDPNFPANPYVYVLYTYDHRLGSTQPALGHGGHTLLP